MPAYLSPVKIGEISGIFTIMKLYLIRHGETTGDIEGRFGGDYDDHLTEKGQTQAKELAESLKNKGLEVILHSPRIRAVETAKAISNSTGASLEELQNLRERNNFGVITGMTKAEAADQHPEELAKIEKDRIYHDVKDSESYEDTHRRVEKVFSEINNRPEESLAVVAHGGVISTLLREKFGHDNVKIGDCGVIEMDYDGNNHKIVCLTNVEIPN